MLGHLQKIRLTLTNTCILQIRLFLEYSSHIWEETLFSTLSLLDSIQERKVLLYSQYLLQNFILYAWTKLSQLYHFLHSLRQTRTLTYHRFSVRLITLTGHLIYVDSEIHCLRNMSLMLLKTLYTNFFSVHSHSKRCKNKNWMKTLI